MENNAQSGAGILNDKVLMTALLSGITQPTFILDVDGLVLYLNQALADRLNKTTADLLGKNIYSYLPKELAEHRKNLISTVFQSNKPLSFDDVHDGKSYTNHIYPIIDTDGKTKSVVIFALDITDRKKDEDELKIINDAMMGRELKMIDLKKELETMKDHILSLEARINKVE